MVAAKDVDIFFAYHLVKGTPRVCAVWPFSGDYNFDQIVGVARQWLWVKSSICTNTFGACTIGAKTAVYKAPVAVEGGKSALDLGSHQRGFKTPLRGVLSELITGGQHFLVGCSPGQRYAVCITGGTA